ncbi:hypothetical protein APS56_11260 [Pseudalgibacter alginicilyticus]|uniref:Uncharacterized protein n=1 Tax=Pseudalgibacter alginicilyticus TaxID=1736674 RepID=A0A0P0D9V9_9FLAO|nr:hypothetical protein [Pseudalgibacter alginicilyticus]ALJ05669.1 hypothetical protein APS56_11260 [Pseudalgibacter alginicilyticus]
MKKKIESELVSIAHRILKLKGKEDVNRMHAEVSELYEKLSVLKFANENFEGELPTIGNDSSFFGMLDEAFNNKVTDTVEVEDKTYVDLDDSENEPIMEPAIEKIKDIVAQMPEETHEVDAMLEAALPKQKFSKNDLEHLTSGYEKLPVFEPVSKSKNINSSDKKSLNEKLNSGGIKVGLNDKIAFIKHLFDGKNEDYDRVLSQINTTANFNDAREFIQNIVKPDYNNWAGKEEFEERLMQIIESKF